jgi:hypothetical protein
MICSWSIKFQAVVEVRNHGPIFPLISANQKFQKNVIELYNFHCDFVAFLLKNKIKFIIGGSLNHGGFYFKEVSEIL